MEGEGRQTQVRNQISGRNAHGGLVGQELGW